MAKRRYVFTELSQTINYYCMRNERECIWKYVDGKERFTLSKRLVFVCVGYFTHMSPDSDRFICHVYIAISQKYDINFQVCNVKNDL